MAKPKLAHGDVFALPLPGGEYLFGRVMLDVRKCVRQGLLPKDSPLLGLSPVLVEMHCGVSATTDFQKSELLIPGAFVQPQEIGKTWPIVANVPVDPREVRFPESLVGFMHDRGQCAFECGEMRIPLPLSHDDYERIAIRKTLHSSFLWPFTCLRQLGRGSEVPTEYVMASLHHSDLRVSPERARVYRYLPFKASDPYFEQQAMMGLDVSRLY